MTTAEPIDDYNYEDYNYNYTIIYEDFVFLCENVDTNLFGATLTVIIYSLIFILSVVGNSLLLWIMLRYEKLRTITDIFIVNLAISDLLFATSLLFWAKDHASEWVFGNIMCKLLSGIFFIGYYSGIMFLTLMTADRYFAVVHAVYASKSRKISYAVITSFIVWAISLSASVPEMLHSTEVILEQTMCVADYPEGSELSWSLFGYYQQIILFFLIPLIVIVFCYYKIMKTVLRCKARKKYKAVKVILCIVVVFFLCWAPYNVMIFLISLKELNVSPFTTCEVSKYIDYAYFISRDLAYFHCCLNPVFYAFVGTKFRMHLKKLFGNRFPCRRTQHLWSYTARSFNRSSSHDYSEAFVINTNLL